MYRLNVFPIHIPPLRERKSEIPGLLKHYLTTFNYHEDWGEIKFDTGVQELLINYQWPGNIRELENTCNYLNVSLDEPFIRTCDLPKSILSNIDNHHEVSETAATPSSQHQSTLTIEQALEQSGNNKTQAAKLLGISRMTLWRQLNKET